MWTKTPLNSKWKVVVGGWRGKLSIFTGWPPEKSASRNVPLVVEKSALHPTSGRVRRRRHKWSPWLHTHFLMVWSILLRGRNRENAEFTAPPSNNDLRIWVQAGFRPHPGNLTKTVVHVTKKNSQKTKIPELSLGWIPSIRCTKTFSGNGDFNQKYKSWLVIATNFKSQHYTPKILKNRFFDSDFDVE